VPLQTNSYENTPQSVSISYPSWIRATLTAIDSS